MTAPSLDEALTELAAELAKAGPSTAVSHVADLEDSLATIDSAMLELEAAAARWGRFRSPANADRLAKTIEKCLAAWGGPPG